MASLEKIQAGLPTDVDIGVREIFRILVPGIYALFLLQFFVPEWPLVKLANTNIASRLAASFFFGLIAYGLRPHERWFPFFLFFQHSRKKLNSEIQRVLEVTSDRDFMPEYKYFLETQALDIKERIHYFSSFYYMLEALALFSTMAAYFLWIDVLWQINAKQQYWTTLQAATWLILSSILLHLGVLVAPHGLKKLLTKVVLGAGVATALAALGLLAWRSHIWSAMQNSSVWVPVAEGFALFAVGYVFDRLGSKNWRQIVEEQVVLVNFRAGALRRVAKRWEPF